MSASKTIINKAKGIAFVFDLQFLNVSISAQGTNTLILDPDTDKSKALPASAINPNIQISGGIGTDAAIADLIKKSPQVQEFIDLLLEKATEDYVFAEEAVTTARKAAAQ